MPGQVYTREALATLFGIQDATIRNGVFKPAGSASVWLFVTKEKSADRVQYADRFDGELLHWQGQLKGRTDRLVSEHKANGDELLVFYRESRRSYPSAGFRYEGSFDYVSHVAGPPSDFLLARTGFDIEAEAPDDEPDAFDPTDIVDGRTRTMALVRRRQGQRSFRRQLLVAYGARCAVTGCAVEPLLEAAHISPYLGPKTNHVSNGLLLRADIHTLFDCGLIAVDQAGKIVISARIGGSDYQGLAGQALAGPAKANATPSAKALAMHYETHFPAS